MSGARQETAMGAWRLTFWTMAGFLILTVLGSVAASRFGTIAYFGLVIIGTLIVAAAIRMEVEKDAAVGSPYSVELYAQQIRQRERMNRAEKAAAKAETERLLETLFLVKLAGLCCALAGVTGYLFVS